MSRVTLGPRWAWTVAIITGTAVWVVAIAIAVKVICC